MLPAQLTKDPLVRFKGIQHLIGNTPLLAIRYRFRGSDRTIYAKAEHMNLTGSIKDRMAFHVLKSAYEDGTLHEGDTIVEATSGNTGISFSAIGRALGHRVVIYMPDWMSRERVDLIRSLGSRIVPVSHEEGGFLGSIRLTEEFAKSEPNVFLPCQFANSANVAAHEASTGPEIWWQLRSRDVTPDAFVAGVGTGGTVMGIGKFLRAMNPAVKIHPVEPAESPTLSTGHKIGKHRIQGISDEFIPAIVKLDELDEIVAVRDGDGILMAQKLSAQLGLAVGISSGANFIAAVKVQDALGPQSVVATVFSDDNKKYLSTDLLREEPVQPDYLSPKITLTDYESIKRMCRTCCDRYSEDCAINGCDLHIPM